MPVNFETCPEKYNHLKITIEKSLAIISMDISEDKGMSPEYKLKLNSYDLGVDIELYDALNRIRFEEPNVKTVIITSSKERMFCSGANIYMLGISSHEEKVNFCKFTNETRNGMEDSSKFENIKFLAAVNGVIAGGGYELALACDKILMVDDKSSTISLPEVPLLAVLPGTGGLTRLIEKRKVRRDIADFFCSKAEGVKAEKALEWKLVDFISKVSDFKKNVEKIACQINCNAEENLEQVGIKLKPLNKQISENKLIYNNVIVNIDHKQRSATIILHSPKKDTTNIKLALSDGSHWWPLEMIRELDDAILLLRTNYTEIGLWIFKTRGSLDLLTKVDNFLYTNKSHWFVNATISFIRRTFARLEVSSRTIFSIVDKNSCFAGIFLELLFASDRSYMLNDLEKPFNSPKLILSNCNFNFFHMINGLTRLENRFYRDKTILNKLRKHIGIELCPKTSFDLGLITFIPDDLDWDDELRLSIEERISLSPDALSGLEANLRFSGSENTNCKVFGRLSAWQNWIFNRSNAVGENGALSVFGKGVKPKYKWKRV